MKSSFNSHAVIGLGFGDEGKGLTTHSLYCNLNDSLVVRYSGGQQAGHTVTTEDTSHVFSNFGSGTFAGTPTYWSKYCTVDPVGIMREFKILKSKGITPILYIDRKCPVTTPYEKKNDQLYGTNRINGTCGVGVGETFAREEAFYSFTVGDLELPSIAKIKLELLAKRSPTNLDFEEFNEAVDFLIYTNNIKFVHEIPKATNVIFEGSQGLLLDQHNGFFPHVTRSNTGTKNILEMVHNPHLYLVTRAYQTRHGNGPMTNTDKGHNILDNPDETNITNEYQGKFRKSILDLDLLKYAMDRDEGIRNSLRRTLIITCCDLIEGNFHYTSNDTIFSYINKEQFGLAVADFLGIERFIIVDDPSTIIETQIAGVVYHEQKTQAL